MCESAILRAKVPTVVCGARSFKHIYEVTFNPARLNKVGPILEPECRELYVRWIERRGFNEILEYEKSGEGRTAPAR